MWYGIVVGTIYYMVYGGIYLYMYVAICSAVKYKI